MSKWTYLLVFSDEFMSADEVKHFLNAREDVADWAHIFDNVYFLVGLKSANYIGDALMDYVKKNQQRQKPKGNYVIVEPTDDRQGWIASVGWNLLRYKSTEKPEKTDDDVLDEEIPF